MLTLRVVSFKGEAFPAPYAVDFDETGGSVGRKAANRLALSHDAAVSTVHAKVSFNDGHYILTVMGRNLSRLNGRELRNGEEPPYRAADTVVPPGWPVFSRPPASPGPAARRQPPAPDGSRAGGH